MHPWHSSLAARAPGGRGLKTYYVLFVIQLETRRVTLAGITRHPTQEWMQQVVRNLTDAEAGDLQGQRHVLHGRDTKFCEGFRSMLRAGGVEPLQMKTRGCGVLYGSRRATGRVNSCVRCAAPPVTAPPTQLGL